LKAEKCANLLKEIDRNCGGKLLPVSIGLFFLFFNYFPYNTVDKKYVLAKKRKTKHNKHIWQ